MGALKDAIVNQVISENSADAKMESEVLGTWTEGKQQQLRDSYIDSTVRLQKLIDDGKANGVDPDVIDVWRQMLLSYSKLVAQARR